MKNILLIFILYLLPFSLFSQKVDVQLLKSGNAALADWKILDEHYQTVFSGREYLLIDSVPFVLEANKSYILQLSVFEVYNPDTTLLSLRLNNEPIILINSETGVGDHFIPFFTGIRDENVKIMGGSQALIADFPYQVFLISGNEQCGGSIINKKWVITAAHCTKNSDGTSILPSQMSVKAGANNPYNVLDGKTYSVSQVIVHQGFNDVTLLNDIALLKIADSINFPNAVPIKLVTSEDVANGAIIPGVMSWVTGWGLTQVSPDVLPRSLQKVQLPIVSNSQAGTVWNSIPSTDIMAGFLNGNKDACSGDSGGPMVVTIYGEYKLAGIVSWGSPNCNTYGAYTRVSDFETWISTNTGIPKAYKPPPPAGDTLICQGTGQSQYSVASLPATTAYEWKIFPADAGVITGTNVNATSVWNVNYRGIATILLRVTVNNVVSEWSSLKVNIVRQTKLISLSRDTIICARQPVTLSVVAEGYNLIYKWSQNGHLVQTGSSSQLNMPVTTTDNTGDYTCEISGTCGTVLSTIIKLTVYPLTRISYISPNPEVAVGSDVTLEVNSEGHDLTYQWKKDGVILHDNNASQLVLQNVNASDIGLYQSIVTGTCGTVTSDSIYVYVKTRSFSTDPEVFVWPTKTSSEINVALSNDAYYNIRLYNTTGKLIRDLPNCRYQITMNINTLAKGVYIVTVFNSNFRKSIKIIKD